MSALEEAAWRAGERLSDLDEAQVGTAVKLAMIPVAFSIE
jgi:hypothetical protein